MLLSSCEVRYMLVFLWVIHLICIIFILKASNPLMLIKCHFYIKIWILAGVCGLMWLVLAKDLFLLKYATEKKHPPSICTLLFLKNCHVEKYLHSNLWKIDACKIFLIGWIPRHARWELKSWCDRKNMRSQFSQHGHVYSNGHKCVRTKLLRPWMSFQGDKAGSYILILSDNSILQYHLFHT